MAAVFPDTYHANILLEEMTIKKIILTCNLLHVFITFLLDLSIDKVFDLKQTGFFLNSLMYKNNPLDAPTGVHNIAKTKPEHFKKSILYVQVGYGFV